MRTLQCFWPGVALSKQSHLFCIYRKKSSIWVSLFLKNRRLIRLKNVRANLPLISLAGD
jgi:hypothetical protein